MNLDLSLAFIEAKEQEKRSHKALKRSVASSEVHRVTVSFFTFIRLSARGADIRAAAEKAVDAENGPFTVAVLNGIGSGQENY